MTGRFEYQKLSRSCREIRLLELLPSKHHLSKFRPACRVTNTSLGSSPPFLALSYVWGDESNKRVILVNKRPFWVTRNLYDAMMSLRGSESITIWIDAICINQKDYEEKGWQVRLMGDLYRKATTVLAWLGASDDDSDAVMDYLNRLGIQAEACGLHESPEGCMQVWKAITTMPSYMDDPTKIVLRSWLDGQPLWVSKYALEGLLHSISGFKSQGQTLPTTGLNRLFRRAWWGRVWILQEITLAKTAHFVCGTKRISRRRFRAAFNAYYALWHTLTLKIRQRQALTQYESEVFFMASHRAQIMLSMSRVYRMEKFPLVALLRATCVGSVKHLQQDGYQHLESTNPRDKIFALLSLAEDQEELETLGVFPDYQKSKEEVYIEAMTALLQQNHVSVLSFCRTSGKPSALPSWVPDWSVPMPDTLQDVKPDHLTLYPEFSACGLKRRCQIITSRKDQKPVEISILASIYDEVFQVGNIPRMPVTGTCIDPVHWLYEILRLTYVARDIYADYSDRLRAVIRSSHAAIGYGEDASLERVDRYLDALPILRSGTCAVVRHDIRCNLQHFFSCKTDEDTFYLASADPSRVFHDFMRITPGRSPFVTKKGHLGLTSHCVRQGDLVAVFSGAQVPFIIRRCNGGKYEIVSEAYIDGIMNGEAIESSIWEYIKLA
jgi:hypothetical protein